jgi:hypothetical protein
MILGEVRRFIRLTIIAVFGALVIHSVAAQQDSTNFQSAESLAKKLKQAGLTSSGVQIQPTDFVRSLSKNYQHAMMSTPPSFAALALTDADLPTTSFKQMSMKGIFKVDLLAPTKVRPTEWKHLTPHGVNASQLWSDKHPDLGPPK